MTLFPPDDDAVLTVRWLGYSLLAGVVVIGWVALLIALAT